MNDTNRPPHDDLAPLDEFELQWVDKLAQREPDLSRSEDAFVQAVLQRHTQSPHQPAVISRIGPRAMTYAAAAALLLAAVVGWYALTADDGQTPDQPPIAQGANDPPQPDPASTVVPPERPKVALGKLIAQAQRPVSSPTMGLTTAVREMPNALSLDNLLDLMGDPVPNLKEILAPLDPKKQQSRA